MQSNVTGFYNILEACRHHPVDHLLYASSSSVYGANKKVSFEETDFVDNPVSLYAATKKSSELMAHTYSHLYDIPAIGLRFFTVYGPMGRPDMAYFKFANMYFDDEPFRIYNFIIGKGNNNVNTFFNLDSFFQVYTSKDPELLDSFLKLKDNSHSYEIKERELIAEQELNDIFSLSEMILPKLTDAQKEGYLINIHLKDGINEQFDMLRFSEEKIINIELKSDFPKEGLEGIKNQLKRHQFVLSSINKEMITCTYISKTNEIYLYKGYPADKLKKITFKDLIDLIPENYLLENQLDKINLTQLIISPYSEPKRFKEHDYYLTSEQFKAVKDITESENNKFGITGGPGTGKSLVLFDLAKKYFNQGKQVLIVFCAPISKTETEKITKELHNDFIHISNLKNINTDKYGVILIDEAQRLWKNQFKRLVELNEKTVIFSADHKQTLHSAEKKLNVEQKLNENVEVQVVKLKDKIRNDRSLSSFIQKFLNLKARKVQPYDYNKVQVAYFGNKKSALNYIQMKEQKEDYTPIELTPYQTKFRYKWNREKVNSTSISVHETIGREYNKVLVPLDEHFYYSDEGKLSSDYENQYPYYESESIFQALTRTRSELLLIVINNSRLYWCIQNILTWKNDS